MKKDNLIRGYLLTLILIIIGLFMGQFLVQETIRVNQNDARLVKLAQRQSANCEEIAKHVVILNSETGENERNFQVTKNRLENALFDFERIQNTLNNGDPKLGIKKVENSEEAQNLLMDASILYEEILGAANQLLLLKYDDPISDKKEQSIPALKSILAHERNFSRTMSELADIYEQEAYVNKAASSLAEYILTAGIIGILLLQAIFIFRPAINLSKH